MNIWYSYLSVLLIFNILFLCIYHETSAISVPLCHDVKLAPERSECFLVFLSKDRKGFLLSIS